ncbi:MAG: hypothetical protein HFACDABA_02832 [Anaerolineales bacterium]|nr:hypothetical protein [Anaerolineales bacterium]
MPRVLRTPDDLNAADIRSLYNNFDSPIARLDCGKKCAPHNPNGVPFCCDICHAVPAAYNSEWKTLRDSTNLWHAYRGDECTASDSPTAGEALADSDLPANMILLACLGADKCQRPNRILGCRAFPFFPYISSDHRFLGLACEWEFESVCWVVSNLNQVTDEYRAEFLSTFDHLLATFDEVFENYEAHSQRLRAHYGSRRKRFALLHRNGGSYLVSPLSERMQRVAANQLPRYGYYR